MERDQSAHSFPPPVPRNKKTYSEIEAEARVERIRRLEVTAAAEVTAGGENLPLKTYN